MKKDGQFVGVDEKYIPEGEKYVDNEVNSNLKDGINSAIDSTKEYLSDKDNQEKIKNAGKKGLKIAKRVGIVYLAMYILVGLLIFGAVILIAVAAIKNINNVKEEQDNVKTHINNVNDTINEKASQFEIDSYNGDFEFYAGTQYGAQVGSLLDAVITNNKKGKNILTVIYNGSKVNQSNDILSLKNGFDSTKQYEVTFNYGSNGYINEVEILNK